MKKLRLDLDSLQVESFDPATGQTPLRGTVDANQILVPSTRRLSECGPCLDTAYLSCNRTCFASCNGTCNCPAPSQYVTDCGCPIRTNFCPVGDTRLCPIEDPDLSGGHIC